MTRLQHPARLSAWRRGLLAAALLAGTSLLQPAFALQPGEQQTLTAVGPIDPATNFPTWYQDHTGLTLQLCTANTDLLGLCIFSPVDPTQDNALYQQQIGFFDEAFWWSADASLPIAPSAACPTCADGRIVLAVEAAFGGGPPLRGDEFTFGRIRLRIDAPFAGTYRITHPFGTQTVKVDVPGLKAINITTDVGTSAPDYTGPLKRGIGAFLRWDPAVAPAPPPGYIGDPNVTHTVIGATYNDPATNLPFNKIRVEYLDGPVNLDGAGNNFVETDQFAVSGQIFNGVTLTPLTALRASYADGRTEIVAESAPSASVSVSFDDGAPQSLIGDPTGNFYVVSPSTTMPATARITATNPGNGDTTLQEQVTDLVWIDAAQYDPATQTLMVKANSSNAAALPTLSVAGFGNVSFGTLDATGNLTVAGVPTAPVWVQVNSSLGGTARETVRYTSPSPTGTTPSDPPSDPPPTDPGNTAPVAQNDVATAPIQTSVVINVAANDVDTDGVLNLSSIQIVSPPTLGTIGLIGAAGITYIPGPDFTDPTITDSFSYTVADNAGAVSNVASVTVTVVPAQLSVAQSQFTRSKAEWRIRGTTNASANTTISAYLGTVDPSRLIGSGPVDGAGAFDIRVQGSNQVPVAGSTISVTNNKGTIIGNIPVTIKN
jgi:Big-like domain-containing protein